MRPGRALAGPPRRAARRRVADPDVLALALHAPLGDRRALGRRRRRAVRRLPDVPGASSRPRGRPGPALATAAPRPARRRAPPGLAQQSEPRLQAQAVLRRHGLPRRRAPRRLARLIHAGPTAGAVHARRARTYRVPAVLRRVPRDPRICAADAGPRAHVLPRSQGLPRRGSADEDRPGEHGLFPGGSGTAPRPARRGAGGAASDGPEASRPHDEVRPQARPRRYAPARDPRAAEEGLRDSARPLVPRRAPSARARGVRSRRDPSRWPLPSGDGRAPPVRAREPAAGPPEEALHASRVPALGRALPTEVSQRRPSLR